MLNRSKLRKNLASQSRFASMESLEDRRLMHANPAYNFDSSAAQGSQPNWMSRLPNDIKLSAISMPGTHDTMALHGVAAKTQSMGLNEQLQSGIRYLDIRLGYQDNGTKSLSNIGGCKNTSDECSFQLFHGIVHQKAEFEQDVLAVTEDFLDANPSETVFMRVKDEHSNGLFNDALGQLLDKPEYVGRFLSSDVSGNLPATLADARGKIAIFNDWGGDTTHDFMPRSNLRGNQTEWTILVHELYDHWEKIKGHLTTAAEGSNDAFFENSISVFSAPGPYFAASGHIRPANDAPRRSTGLVTGPVNRDTFPDFPRLSCGPRGITCSIYYEGMNVMTRNRLVLSGFFPDYARVGIVIADFPGQGLIESVIDMNSDSSGKRLVTGRPVSVPADAFQSQPPAARLSQSFYGGVVGDPITFDAGPSSHPNGNRLTYQWELLGAPGTCEQRSSAYELAIQAKDDAFNQFLIEEGFFFDFLAANQEFLQTENGKALQDAINKASRAEAVFVCSKEGSFQVKVAVSDGTLSDSAIADVTVRTKSPELTLTSTGLDLGNTLVGNTRRVTFTAENSGSAGTTLNATFQRVGSDFFPHTDQEVAPLAKGETAGIDYRFEPSVRGSQSFTVNVTSNDPSNPLDSSNIIRGRGVAPVGFLGTNDAGLLRVGTSGNASVFVRNDGDGNLSGIGELSNARGSMEAAAGVFVGAGGSYSLADGAIQTFDFAFAPTERGDATEEVAVHFHNGSNDGKNTQQDFTMTLQGTGVGPEFQSVSHTQHLNASNNPINWGPQPEDSTAESDRFGHECRPNRPFHQ